MNNTIDVGDVLRRVAEVYRDQFGLLIPAALVLFVPVALLNGLVLSSGGVLASLLAAVIGVVATFWFQGMAVEAVRDILDGRRDYSIGSLFRSVTPVLGALIAAGLLAGLATGIGFLLLIVPGLLLLTIWAVLAPVIVVERPGVFPAFERSRELVKGNGWAVFGVIVVIFLVTIALNVVFNGIALAIADNFAGRAIGDLLVRVLIAPLSAIAAAVLYFELKGGRGESVEAFGGDAGKVESPVAPAGSATQEQPAPQGGGPEAVPPPPPATETGPAQPGTPPPPERS